MIPEQLTQLLKSQRLARQLTQSELATVTNITRSRISDFETGRCVPSAHEKHRLAEVLEAPLYTLNQAEPNQSWRVINETFKRQPRRFNPPSDRPSTIRLASAKNANPELVSFLQSRIHHPRAGTFLRDASFGSRFELITAMRFLADGAEPILAAPHRAGFDRWPIVDPLERRVVGYKLFPSLLWNGLLLFFNASLLIGRSVLTPDILLLHPHGKSVVIEIDGSLHHPGLDAERDQKLDLKVVRFGAKEVLRSDFLGSLRARLDELNLGSARSRRHRG